MWHGDIFSVPETTTAHIMLIQAATNIRGLQIRQVGTFSKDTVPSSAAPTLSLSESFGAVATQQLFPNQPLYKKRWLDTVGRCPASSRPAMYDYLSVSDAKDGAATFGAHLVQQGCSVPANCIDEALSDKKIYVTYPQRASA